MLTHLLSQPSCDGISKLETTITKNNEASWALFHSISQWLNAEFKESVFFESDKHFSGQHDSEYLVEIGPFGTQKTQS
jgi:L-2,4-diaminobutyric acid acetyltransferase